MKQFMIRKWPQRALAGEPLRRIAVEFLGYTAASAVALVVDLVTLVVLVGQGTHYLLAATIAFLAGMLVVYLASVSWIFSWRSYRSRQHVEIGVFLFTGVVGLLVNLLILWFGTDVLGFHYLIPKAVSIAFVFSWNFLSRKLMLFTPYDAAP